MHVPVPALFEQHPFLASRRAPINVVVAYDGMAAAQNALDAIESLKRRDPPHALIIRVSTWCFRFLEDAGPLGRATAAAIEADVLVIAAGIESGLPQSVKGWLKASLAKNRKPDVSVVALLGRESGEDAPDSPRFQVVRRIARASGARLCLPQV